MSGKSNLGFKFENRYIFCFEFQIGQLEDRLHLAFSMYDINGDGYLDKKDLSSLYSEEKQS